MAVATRTQIPHALILGEASSTTGIAFRSFDLPSSNQRTLGLPHLPGAVSPLALCAASDDSFTLDDAIESVRSLQSRDGGILTTLLAQHGTLLLRGLPIHNAEDFSRFTHAFGYRPHEIIGIVVDRPLLAPNVAPANESPKEVLIYNHNESPQVPHAPEYIMFYCHRAPKVGGETPVSSSLELFYRAQKEIPEFIETIAEEGILSRVTYKFQRQHAGGSTLKQAFGKEVIDGDDEVTVRAKIEQQIGRYGRGKYTTGLARGPISDISKARWACCDRNEAALSVDIWTDCDPVLVPRHLEQSRFSRLSDDTLVLPGRWGSELVVRRLRLADYA